MAVKGLMPGLLEAGKIKIGIKGEEVTSKDGNTFRLPQKIDHFRIVRNERDENDDYILDDQIIEIIKKNPATVFSKDGNLVGIPIRLLYNEIDLNFPTQYVSYVAGKLSCSGDGVKAYTRDGRETKCPCPRLDGAYTGKDKCKISGTLSCIIEGSNVGGCYKFRTTSINSARYILSSLMLIKAATGGLLSFIPLRLVINPKKTIIPATGAPTTIYVVTLEFQGGIDQLQKKALEMGKERVSLIENMRDIEIEARKIVSSDVDTDREEKEFAEEFFPENIETVEIKKDEKAEKKEPKKKDDAKTTGGKTVKATDKKPAAAKEDKLLGKATGPEVVKPVEPVEPVKSEQTKPAAATATDKIKKDQLEIILNLKVNMLKINDQKAWASLIKGMKFGKDVKKANDMTILQGDKFIEHLKALADIPF